MIDADRFHQDFDGVEVETTGSLAEDVLRLGLFCVRAYYELYHPDDAAIAFNNDDPASDIRTAAACIEFIKPQLIAQGFAPPTVAYADDPVGVLFYFGEFLTRIAPLVVDPPRTVH